MGILLQDKDLIDISIITRPTMSETLQPDQSINTPIWLLLDGRVGHDKQSLALARHINRAFQPFQLQHHFPWHWLAPTPITGMRFSSGIKEARRIGLQHPPELIISCGRRSAQAALYLKKQLIKQKFNHQNHRHKSVQLLQILNPRRHLSHFDLIITPSHDQISGPNIIKTPGAIHDIDENKLATARQQWMPQWAHWPRPWLGILLGGGDQKQLEEQVNQIRQHLATGDYQQATVMCSTSRRTPANIIQTLHELLATRPGFVFPPLSSNPSQWNADTNPYLGILACADHLFVSTDSINMITECLATQNALTILGTPHRKTHRRFHQQLGQYGIIKGQHRVPTAQHGQPPNYKAVHADSDINGVLLADLIAQHLQL